jgi:hypothetical protein
MAIASISAWLNNPNRLYLDGVALFRQFGTDVLLQALLDTGSEKSNYHRTRLTTALQALNARLQDQPASPAQPSPSPRSKPEQAAVQQHAPQIIKVARHSLTDPEWEKAPDAIKDLYVRNKELVSEAELAYHHCRIVTSDAARLELAQRILDNRDQVNENWQAIKTYHATGEIAKQITAACTPAVERMTPAELTAIIRNYPTYITKDNAKLEGALTTSRREKITKRLQERQIMLDLVKRRIANVQLVQE